MASDVFRPHAAQYGRIGSWHLSADIKRRPIAPYAGYLTAKLEKSTIKVDLPKLTPEDEKKLRKAEAKAQNAR